MAKGPVCMIDEARFNFLTLLQQNLVQSQGHDHAEETLERFKHAWTELIFKLEEDLVLT